MSVHRSLSKLKLKKKSKRTPQTQDEKEKNDFQRTPQKWEEKEIEVHHKLTFKQQMQEKAEQELLKKKDEDHRIIQNKPSNTEYEKENNPKVLVHSFASKGKIPKKKKSKKYKEEKHEIIEQILPGTAVRPSFNTKTIEESLSPVSVLEVKPVTRQRHSTNPFEDSDDEDEEEEVEYQHIVSKKSKEPEKNISPPSENIEIPVQTGITETEKDDAITQKSLKRKRSSSVRRKMSKILRKRSQSRSEDKKSESASVTHTSDTHKVSRQSPESDVKTTEAVSSLSGARGRPEKGKQKSTSDVKTTEAVSSLSGARGRPEKGKQKSTNPFDDGDDDIEESVPQRNFTSRRKYTATPRDVKTTTAVSSISGMEVRPEKGKQTSTNPFDEDDDDIEESIPPRKFTPEREYTFAFDPKPSSTMVTQINVKEERDSSTKNKKSLPIHRKLSRKYKSSKKKSGEDTTNVSPTDSSTEMKLTKMAFVESNIESQPIEKHGASQPEGMIGSTSKMHGWNTERPIEERAIDVPLPSCVRPILVKEAKAPVVNEKNNEMEDTTANEKVDDKNRYSFSLTRSLSKVRSKSKIKRSKSQEKEKNEDVDIQLDVLPSVNVESNYDRSDEFYRREEIAHDDSLPKHVHHPTEIDEEEQIDDVLEIVDESTEHSNNGSQPFRLGFSKLRSSFKRKSKRPFEFKEGLIAPIPDTSQKRSLSPDKIPSDQGYSPVRAEITPVDDPFEASTPDEEKGYLKKKNPFQHGVSIVRSSFRKKPKNQQNEETPEPNVNVKDDSTNNQESAKHGIELIPAGISPKRQLTVEEVLADLGCTPDGREINPTDDPFETSGQDLEKVNLRKKSPFQRSVSKVRSSFRRKSKNQQNEESTDTTVNDEDQSTNRQESVKEEVEELPSPGVPQKQLTVEEVLADLGYTADGREINPTDETFEETAQDEENGGENINEKNKNILQRRVSKLRSSFRRKRKNSSNETSSDPTVTLRDRSTSENVDEYEEMYSPLIEPSTKREFTKAEVLSDSEFSPEKTEIYSTDISEKKSNKSKSKKKKHKKQDERDAECIEPLMNYQNPITIERKKPDDFVVEFRSPQKVPPTKHQLIEMRSNVDDVKQSLSDNLQKLEDRAGNLDELEALADSLSDKTNYFVKCSSEVKKKMRCRDYKWKIIIISTVSFVILVMMLIIIVFITQNTDNTQDETAIATNLTNIQNV